MNFVTVMEADVNKNILIPILSFLTSIEVYGQENEVFKKNEIPDQISDYVYKLQKSEAQEKEIENKEKLAKEIQKGNAVNYVVPALNVKKENKKHKKIEINPEDDLEKLYLNNNENYRKLEKSKPYVINGVVTYTYGIGEAIVICSIQNVCDIELGKGESISNIQLGDSERWILKVNNSTSLENSPHIIIKPKQLNLRSNMIIFTEKRQYNIQLKSIKKKYFSKVAFNYPDEIKKMTTVFTDIPEISKYKYKIKGDSTAWTPDEIRTDGKKTFIKLSHKFAHSPDMPTIYSLDSDGSQSQVNYRLFNGWIIVDVILDKGQLIQGVGLNQRKVIFSREGTVGILSKLFSAEK